MGMIPAQSHEGDCELKVGTAGIECRLVRHRLSELLAHPSYERHRLSVSASQLSAVVSLGSVAFREPIKVTRNLTIIDGYARFQLARQQARETIDCLEYDLSEEQALYWLIEIHRPSKGRCAFDRVALALDLEPAFQRTARANQQWGGENKGSSTLTTAQKMHVRSEIAAVARVSAGNVEKVRRILKDAHSNIQRATKAGEISIHMAWQCSRLSVCQQLTKLDEYRSRKGINQTSRRLIQKHVAKLAPTRLLPPSLGDLLKAFVHDRSSALDCVVVSEIDSPGKIAYFTKEALHALTSKELSK
jgi:hypothetical protein